jgi:hypothetical protein
MIDKTRMDEVFRTIDMNKAVRVASKGNSSRAPET